MRALARRVVRLERASKPAGACPRCGGAGEPAYRVIYGDDVLPIGGAPDGSVRGGCPLCGALRGLRVITVKYSDPPALPRATMLRSDPVAL